MGACAKVFGLLFLSGAIALQIASFAAPYMVETPTVQYKYGVFQRCYPIYGCRWWTGNWYTEDPDYMKILYVLSFASCGLLGLVTIFCLIGFITDSRVLNSTSGVLVIINSILLIAILVIFTKNYDIFGIFSKEDNAVLSVINSASNLLSGSGGALSTVALKFSDSKYSWSYWSLCCAIIVNFLTPGFFFASTPKYKY